MQVETEVKLCVEDLAGFYEAMKPASPRLILPRTLEDNYVFDYPDLRLRQEGCLLRVRIMESGSRLTFKGPATASQTFKTREEWETGVADGTMLVTILQNAGFRIWFRYQKYRTEYEISGEKAEDLLHVALDETPIGNYVELEGSEYAIQDFARRMGYATGDFIRSSYYSLYVQRCRERGETPSFMLIEPAGETPRDNR